MAYPDLARRLKFLASTTRRHGLGHLVEIARQRRARARFAQHPPLLPAPNALAQQLRGTDQPAPWLNRWRTAIALPDPDLLTRALRTNPKREAVIAAADGFAAGRFTALGVSLVEPAGTFHWHRDYTSGRLWPYTPHDTIRFIGGDGSDVKYPWELNRMYGLGWLGLAWRATGEHRYVEQFRRVVDDWRGWNEPWRGVNWAMPMEVGIRGTWLVLAAGLFADAEIDPVWWMEYEQLVWAHGRYLAENFEYFANLTNHYVANCLGLLAVGATMPEGSAERAWFDEGRTRLLRELDRQVYPDGVHYELSIGYHRLVLEMMLLGVYFARRGGKPFEKSALEKIGLMAEFVRDYTPGHGSAPQLGDSDDGVLLRLEPERDLYDHRDTLSLAGALLGRTDLVAASGERSLSSLILAPEQGTAAPPSEQATESRLYGNGGFAILRSERLHVLADVGEIGLHGNNDTLAFTLSSARTAWIVDPGTYCYTRDPELRNTLRSSSRHNAPTVDGAETAPFSGLWRVRYDHTDTAVDEWSPKTGLLVAHHRAYRDRGVEVRRRWELAGDSLSVRDTLAGTGAHTWSCCFTVPEGIEAVRRNERTVELRADEGTVRLECSHPIEMEAGWYSPSYGVARSATLIRTGEREVGLPVEVSYLWRFVSSPTSL